MHDGMMWVASQQGLLNTEAEYPYVSGSSGKKEKCNVKPGPVNTGVHCIFMLF